jgi:hypothetical protein
VGFDFQLKSKSIGLKINVELKSVFQRLSIAAIYKLSCGSKDYFTVSDEIIRASYIRPILEPLQIISAIKNSSTSNCHIITFQFSPDFLENHFNLALGGLSDISWRFILPAYELSEIDEETGEEITEEIGVVEWLSSGHCELELPKYLSIDVQMLNELLT